MIDDTESTIPMFADVVEQWLDHIFLRVDLSPMTVITYRRVSDHLRAWGAARPLGTIEMAPYVLLRRGVGAAPRTISLELRVANAIFNWAVRTGAVDSAAQLTIPRLKIDKNRFVLNHRTPTPSEAAKAIATMHGDWKLAALLIARTGARIGEIVYLRGCDLDEAGGRVALGATDHSSKTGMRWFPLDKASLQALRGKSDLGNDLIFEFEGVEAVKHGLQRRLHLACKDANVSRFTPHGLRRMVVNRLMSARVDPGTAAALTGHSVQVMLRYYRTVTDKDRREAAELANLGVLVEEDDSGDAETRSE